jgi:CrcB protein
MPYLLAAVGGVLGALARWGVGTAVPVSPGSWPWATILVNLTGCFLLGVLVAVVGARLPGATWPRPFLAVGVLGGFTTFSAFAVEVVELVGTGAVLTAAGYGLVSVVGGVAGVAIGAAAGRSLVGEAAR